MDATGTAGRVTSSTGNIDTNGDIVGELFRQVAATRGPLEGRYYERSGLDERIKGTGADVASVRRMLRVPS